MMLFTKPLLIGLAVAVLGVGVQTVRLADSQRETTTVRTAMAQAQATAERATREQSERYRKLEKQYEDEIQAIRVEAQRRQTRANADAAAARAVADSLRNDIDRYLADARGATPAPGTTNGSTPATDPGLLLAELFRRIDERAGELAAFADKAHGAGQACERAYDQIVLRPYNTAKPRLLL